MKCQLIGTDSYHRYITERIEWMLPSFHQFYQCYFGNALSRVGVLPVNVEVAEGCGSKLTHFTVERLQFVMN